MPLGSHRRWLRSLTTAPLKTETTRKNGASMELRARFVDRTQAAALDLWPALLVRKEEIDAEVERLAGLPPPPDGRRASLVVHPCAETPGLGLAPGIQVSI